MLDSIKDSLFKETLASNFECSSQFNGQVLGLIVRGRSQSKGPGKGRSRLKL